MTYLRIHLLSSVSMNPDSRRRSNCRVTRSVQKEFFCSAMPYPLRPNVSPEMTRSQSRLASYSSRGESQKKTFILPWERKVEDIRDCFYFSAKVRRAHRAVLCDGSKRAASIKHDAIDIQFSHRFDLSDLMK